MKEETQLDAKKKGIRQVFSKNTGMDPGEPELVVSPVSSGYRRSIRLSTLFDARHKVLAVGCLLVQDLAGDFLAGEHAVREPDLAALMRDAAAVDVERLDFRLDKASCLVSASFGLVETHHVS